MINFNRSLYKLITTFLSAFLIVVTVKAGITDSIRLEEQILGVASTGKYAPFGLYANTHGLVSIRPYSYTALLGLSKQTSAVRNIDWGFCAQGIAQNTKLMPKQLYVNSKLYCFDVTLGVVERVYGNQYAPLSSGGMLFSGNSRGVPMLSIGMPDYFTLPFTFGLVEIKGTFDNGIFLDKTAFVKNTLMHYKNGYVRLGGKLPIRISYGLQHAVQWGGTHPVYGSVPITLGNFWRIFSGEAGGSDSNPNEQLNKLGNHLISQSMGIELEFLGFKLAGYCQNILETNKSSLGPFSFVHNSINLPDKLMGFTLTNTHFKPVNAILFEYLNTTDQWGPYLSKDGVMYGGNVDYYSNYYYQSWSYRGLMLGNPLLTSPIFNADGGHTAENNRVKAWHAGISGVIVEVNYKTLFTLSHNYGSYSSVYSPMRGNTSFSIELNKTYKQLYNCNIGVSFAVDAGQLYGNSFGAMISIKKQIFY